MLLQENLVIHHGNPEPQKDEGIMYFQSVAEPETSSHPIEALVTDTNHHTGKDHCPDYEEICKIFNSSYFPMNDEDLEVYQNILKSGIHLVVSRPQIFPYNEATQWFLKQFDATTTNIMRKQGK